MSSVWLVEIMFSIFTPIYLLYYTWQLWEYKNWHVLNRNIILAAKQASIKVKKSGQKEEGGIFYYIYFCPFPQFFLDLFKNPSHMGKNLYLWLNKYIC